MTGTIGVAVPSIPPRGHLLSRALASVAFQKRPVDQISVVIDHERRGGSATRNAAALALDTDWIAFLDDDDEYLPHFTDHLLHEANWYGDIGMIWGWFSVVGGEDPFPPDFRYRQYEAPDGHCVPISYMVRRDLFVWAYHEMGGFQDANGSNNWGVQDLPLIDTLHELMGKAGLRSLATGEVCWRWHHHGFGMPGEPGNTSGRGDRW